MTEDTKTGLMVGAAILLPVFVIAFIAVMAMVCNMGPVLHY